MATIDDRVRMQAVSTSRPYIWFMERFLNPQTIERIHLKADTPREIVRPLEMTTRRTLGAPVRHVWGALSRPERIVARWDHVRLAWPADPPRQGARHEWTVHTPLRATLRCQSRIDRLDLHRRLDFTLTGDLTGTGRLTLQPDGPKTRVALEIRARTTHPALRVLAMIPGARAVLKRAHDQVAAAGIKALAAEAAQL